MAFRSGRLQIFEDKTTAVSEYTTTEWDSMSLPLANQLCSMFGMVVLNSLTTLTDRGHRYFIGYEDDPTNPKMAVGWAVGNTNSSYRYLCVVGMYDGVALSNILDYVSSSTISGDQYGKVMLTKQISGQNTNITYFYYLSDDHFNAITQGVQNPSESTINSIIFQIAQFKAGTRLIMGYRQNSSSYPYYYTYDYYDNGIITTICAQYNYFPTCKNYIANSDYEYITPYRLEHNLVIDGLYIYSKVLTINKIYSINGEYYFCLYTNNSNVGSYLMKINFIPGQ